MKQLMFAFLVLFGKICFAQNWDPILKNNVSAFYNNSDGTLAIKIDSITTTENDSVFHFYKTWDDGGDYSCFKPNGPSWIGANATKKLNNTWLFSNYEGESLTLHPKANVDSTWVFYTFPNGTMVNCTVTQASLETILGTQDSVKTFEFKLVSEEGVPVVPNPYEELSIKIAKNFGFVKLFPLRHFEYSYYDHYLHLELNNFDLVGVSKFELGKTIVNYTDIYNFDIGNEFHYTYFHHTYSNCYSNKQTIKTVISKEIQEPLNNIKYGFMVKERSVYTDNSNPSNNSETISTYTTSLIVNQSNPVVYFPEEAVPNFDEAYGKDGYSQSFWANNRIMLMGNGFGFTYAGDGCWDQLVPIAKSSHFYYIAEGLGDVGYESDGDNYVYLQNLVYYKKGEETWGTPLVITSTSAPESNKLNVYPNPVKAGEKVYIEGATSQILVSITTMAGVQVAKVNVNSSENGIVVPKNTPTGIYFITLQGNGAERIVRKVIVLN